MSCGCQSKKIFDNFISTQLSVIKKLAKEGQDYGVLIGQPQTEGKKIKGKLAYAGVSLNNRLYLPEELAKGDGMTVPLIINHASVDGAEDELYNQKRLSPEIVQALENGQEVKVGYVSLSWDPATLTLSYEGVIEDPFFIKEVAEANMAVSLGMYYDADSPKVCDHQCYTVIRGAEFHEVSLVYHPGFPIATIEAAEALLKKKATEAKTEDDSEEKATRQLEIWLEIRDEQDIVYNETMYDKLKEWGYSEDIAKKVSHVGEAIGPHSRGYNDQINVPTSTPEITGSNSTGKFEDPKTRLARARMNQNISPSKPVKEIEWEDEPETGIESKKDLKHMVWEE